MNPDREQRAALVAIAATAKLFDAIFPKIPKRNEPEYCPLEPTLANGGRLTRTMPFRYAGVDFIITYKIDVNGDTELWDIKSTDDLAEGLKQNVLDEADNQIRRHAADNPKA